MFGNPVVHRDAVLIISGIQCSNRSRCRSYLHIVLVSHLIKHGINRKPCPFINQLQIRRINRTSGIIYVIVSSHLNIRGSQGLSGDVIIQHQSSHISTIARIRSSGDRHIDSTGILHIFKTRLILAGCIQIILHRVMYLWLQIFRFIDISYLQILRCGILTGIYLIRKTGYNNRFL